MVILRLLFRLFALVSGVVIFLVILYSLSFYIQYPKSPIDLIKEDKLVRTDALVFLGGSSDRFDYAFDLFNQGFAPRLYSPGGESPGMRRYIRNKMGVSWSHDLIFDDSVPDGTYGEAINTARFASKHQIRSLILVTSPYHTYRAQWIFKKMLPTVNIISVSVPYNRLQLIDAAAGNATAIFKSEQKKFLGYYILYTWPFNQPWATRFGRHLQHWLERR